MQCGLTLHNTQNAECVSFRDKKGHSQQSLFLYLCLHLCAVTVDTVVVNIFSIYLVV